MRDFNAELHNVMKNGINRPSAEALKPVKTRQPPSFCSHRSENRTSAAQPPQFALIEAAFS